MTPWRRPASPPGVTYADVAAGDFHTVVLSNTIVL